MLPPAGEVRSLSWPLERRCSVLFLSSVSSWSDDSLSLSCQLPWASSFLLLRSLLSPLRLPGHFFLLTTHFLVSDVGPQGLPWGEGTCRISRTLVSSPRLKPHTFPLREQGPHSPHSLTSQCTCGVHAMICSLGS